MNARELNEFNDRMIKEWNAAKDTGLAEEILRLLETRTPEQITTDPAAADCWWHLCEEMADRIAKERPEDALRLLELARVSNVKEGTYATGSGEGIASVTNVNRIQRKIDRLKKRGEAPPRKTCSCGRAFDPAQRLARLEYEHMGDTYTLFVGRCADCGDRWQALVRDKFLGEVHEHAASMHAEDANELIALIKSCPNPDNKRCTCHAHQKIAWY